MQEMIMNNNIAIMKSVMRIRIMVKKVVSVFIFIS